MPHKSGYPSGKVGGYRAPVDTTGMDEAMKETMGFMKKKPKIVMPSKPQRAKPKNMPLKKGGKR